MNICILKTKEDIEKFINHITDLTTDENMPLNNNSCLLLKIISLYLFYECQEEDRTANSIIKLLKCCFKEDYTFTIFEMMLTSPRVNSEPLQLYKELVTAVGNPATEEFETTVTEALSAIFLYVLLSGNKGD